jgi:hypothetical protein
MKQMQRGAAGIGTPQQEIGETKRLSFAHHAASVNFLICYATGLTGWPAELVAEIAAAPNRCVAKRLVEASAGAIDTLSDDRRELLLSRLQDTIAELAER